MLGRGDKVSLTPSFLMDEHTRFSQRFLIWQASQFFDSVWVEVCVELLTKEFLREYEIAE